jgi:drug/metabolite transporter (DMT)-like permease
MSYRVLFVFSFLAIYLIWGSTYLAIRLAVDSLPPLLMTATRSLVAGGLLFVLRARRPLRMRVAHWRSAGVAGGLLFLGGHGLLAWSEQRIDSGLAALMVASMPIWMAIMMMISGRKFLGWATSGGVVLGFIGVAILMIPGGMTGSGGREPVVVTALLLAALFWAGGSLYARQAPLPDDVGLSTAMQLLAGGVLLSLVGTARGEWHALDPARITSQSLIALAYLIVFGSLVAFSAYSWLLRVAEPALVGTYAFVNPIVAIALGCAIGGEGLGPSDGLAGAVIVAAVVLVHFGATTSPAKAASPTAARTQPANPSPCRRYHPPGHVPPRGSLPIVPWSRALPQPDRSASNQRPE